MLKLWWRVRWWKWWRPSGRSGARQQRADGGGGGGGWREGGRQGSVDGHSGRAKSGGHIVVAGLEDKTRLSNKVLERFMELPMGDVIQAEYICE